VILLRGRFST